MPPDTAPNQPAGPRSPAPAAPAPADPPALPDRGPADSDAAWGEAREPDDDERLAMDRPPHWDAV
jgi:hypothetical protein